MSKLLNFFIFTLEFKSYEKESKISYFLKTLSPYLFLNFSLDLSLKKCFK